MLRAVAFGGRVLRSIRVASVLLSAHAHEHPSIDRPALCFRIDDSGAPRQISTRTLADPIECKSPPSHDKTVVHLSVRSGEPYPSHREVRNRVPENIVDGNYFLIRRSIARLKLWSTIRGLRRSYLYLSHECNIYNTHERSRGALPSQFDVNFVGLLRAQIRVDFTLHAR